MVKPVTPAGHEPAHSQAGGKGLSSPVATQSKDDLPMPHERDQGLGQVAREPDPVIDQARKDLDAGQVDTDMRATPGLDAARRARLVDTPPRGTQRAAKPRRRRG
jgi:hypothetical protein